MSEKSESRAGANDSRGGPRPGRVVALAATGAVALALFWIYAGAVSDGMARYFRGEWERISPDFTAQDPRRAETVPDFTLADRFGNPVSLSQFDSIDLLLINIWSSGCRVCLEEAPELAALDRELASLGKVALITIAIDESWADVAHHFPRGTNLRVLFDPDDEVGRGVFGTKAYPETFVLDSERRIRARFDGRRPWASDTMLGYLESFL